MVKPSGYCGAIRNINHTGRKKVAIKLRDPIAIIILEGRLIFDILRLFKLPGKAPAGWRGFPGTRIYSMKDLFGWW
jgi:hypothetical protein